MSDAGEAAAGEAPVLSVITASRGRPGSLRRKALAMARQTLAPAAFEWRLWLNEPAEETARTRALLQDLRLPFAVRVDGGRDLPVGRARNLAADGARGRLLLLSDDDCMPDPGAFAAHVAFHDATPDAVGIGPLRLPDAMRAGGPAEPFERPLAFGRRAAWINLTGANSSVPADAFRAVSGYDPDWHGYGGEDPELALRLRGLGLRFRHVPEGGAVHEGRVWEDPEKAYRAGWAQRRVADRHPGAAAWMLGVHPLLLAAKRVVLDGPWSRGMPPEIRAYERAYARGARDAARRPRLAVPPPGDDAAPRAVGSGHASARTADDEEAG